MLYVSVLSGVFKAPDKVMSSMKNIGAEYVISRCSELSRLNTVLEYLLNSFGDPKSVEIPDSPSAHLCLRLLGLRSVQGPGRFHRCDTASTLPLLQKARFRRKRFCRNLLLGCRIWGPVRTRIESIRNVRAEFSSQELQHQLRLVLS